MIETPIRTSSVEIVHIVASPAVPPGMAVLVGRDGIIKWMGPANDYASGAGDAGGSLNFNPNDYAFIKARAALLEKGIPVS